MDFLDVDGVARLTILSIIGERNDKRASSKDIVYIKQRHVMTMIGELYGAEV